MTQMKQLFKREEGFTLIEMSLVLFIISALLMLFIPNVSGQQDSANTTGDKAFQAVLQAQVDLYKMKGNKTITFDALESEDYLSASQLEKAEAGFTITNGVVTIRPK